MALRIEDYALIGDTQTAALVGLDGSLDWLCLPRFDSGACFAALLGTPEHGRWRIAPAGPVRSARRRYLPDTLVLETELTCDEGTVRLIDFMPVRGEAPDVVRIVEGVRGQVPMHMELRVRFDYGHVVPWAQRLPDGRLHLVAGPDALVLRSDLPHHGERLTTVSDFSLGEGQRAAFTLTWHPSHHRPPEQPSARHELEVTEAWWRKWTGHCAHQLPWRDAVVRSLQVLKALTYAPTGGIVAAPTTSLPEWIGSVRNWDYRFCWLRDATLTLQSLLAGGYREEAAAWRDWLLRAVGGDPSQLRIMYGLGGERRLPEEELDWLPGYEGSLPVRVGNAAASQLQLDVYGEVVDALYQARRAGLPAAEAPWALQRQLLEYLEGAWQQPDEGIWEVRGPRQHFTHSKLMCWVAFDRAVRTVETWGLPGPVERWRAQRDAVHAEVCARAWNPEVGAFTQAYGSRHLDASVLLLAELGFLPPSDPRFVSTVDAIARGLKQDGLVLRYRTDASDDGLPPGEGAFLACSFWLADAYALIGRNDEARALFEHLLSLRNDVGLLAEEYDPVGRRQLGNFPQAFSHVGLVDTAFNLWSRGPSPALDRGKG